MKDAFFAVCQDRFKTYTNTAAVAARAAKAPLRFGMSLIFACALGLGICANAVAAPVLVNGSLDGAVGPDTAASGWTVANATPDIVDENGPFNKTDVLWTLSPDGGTFARCNGHHADPSQFSEAFEQTVSGFEVGASYTLELFQTNLGFLDFDDWVNRNGHWGLFVDGNLVGQSSTIGGPASVDDPITWVSDGISFTATETVHTIRLQAYTDDDSGIAYMGIDGLQLINTKVAVEDRGMGNLKGAYLR